MTSDIHSTARNPGLFVTGTDTDVGKTHIASLILRCLRVDGHSVGAYKPVCSGAIQEAGRPVRWDDIDRLRTAAGGTWPDDVISPQRFLAPLAPPMAARREGREVDFSRAVDGTHWWHGRVDILLVEGAGGLLAPVTQVHSVADLAKAIGYPLIIVARCGLGTINHTLLTIEAARSRELTIAGVVLNQSHPSDDLSLAEANAAEIETRGAISVLGVVNWGSTDGLHRHGRPVTIAWSDLAGC